MTLEQATQLATSLNNTLVESGADVYVTNKVFAYWAVNYNKLYNVTLIPTSLNANYEAATDSQKLAFARVSLWSQLNEPTTYEGFVNTFNGNVSKDAELDNYLNK